MSLFQRFLHVSILTKDIEKSKWFYANVIGLKEVARPKFPFEGAWYDLKDGIQLHVLANPSHPSLSVAKEIQRLAPHFALSVNDPQDVYDRLKKFNCPFKTVEDEHVVKQIFVHDPDGNMVEFLITPTASSKKA